MLFFKRHIFVFLFSLSFLLDAGTFASGVDDGGFRRVFVARHGQRPSGGDPALTRLGVLQAKHLAERIKSVGFDGGIYASPYLRTVETAAQTAELLGLKIKLEAAFQERTHIHGTPNVEGRSQRELEGMFPGLISPNPVLKPSWVAGDNYGEALSRRAADALERILRDTKGDVFIVTHKAVVLALAAWMSNSGNGVKFENFEVWNCELVYFIVDSKGRFKFVSAGVDFIPPEEVTNNFKAPLLPAN